MVDARGIIGNYIVERELGRGGMGVVYAAKHRVLGRPAAIKLLLANAADDRGRVERFFNEARAAMAIDHPGVVKIYDVGIAADDRPYIAMELLDGMALSSLVGPAGLPIRQGIEYACQIASALAAAHDAGVIHRDLKPENIIISRDRSRAIVVDFGIAKLAHQATVRTATGALVGTPLYMSPEQCEGLRELDARSDLYAFGCVIFAMLTGRPPFFEGGTGGLIGMHLHVAPPPLRTRCPAASEALERVVSVLLAKSPDARFRTARAALAALQAPEVRGLAAAPGVPATADFAPREGGLHSVQPWAATQGTAGPVSGTPWAPAYGAGASISRSPEVQAVGTPGPSTLGRSMSGQGAPAPGYVSYAPTPQAGPTSARAPAPSRGKTIIAIVASCALTAVVAIVASRGCGSGNSIDAGVATGSDAGTGSSGITGSAGSNVIANAPVDAGVPVDATAITTNARDRTGARTTERTTSKGTTKGTTKGTPPKATQKAVQPDAPTPRPSVIDPAEPARPDKPGANETQPPPEPAVVRRAIHDHFRFAKGDFGASLGQRVLDRVAAHHREDPTRRIIITGHAEQDEPGVLETLAAARANTAFTHLINRGVPRSVLVMNSTRFIDPATPDGANRRVNIDFE